MIIIASSESTDEVCESLDWYERYDGFGFDWQDGGMTQWSCCMRMKVAGCLADTVVTLIPHIPL